MLVAGAILFAVTAVAAGMLGIKLRLSLKREAPQLYEKIWQKSFGSHTLRMNRVLPFVMMIFLRRYRHELADYPVSRAWASWLSAVSWLQLGAYALIAVAALRK